MKVSEIRSGVKEEIAWRLSTQWKVFKLALFYMRKGIMNGVGLQKTSFLCSMNVSQNSSSREKDLGAGKTAQLVKYLINKHEDLS